jgi:hypothetical protein
VNVKEESMRGVRWLIAGAVALGCGGHHSAEGSNPDGVSGTIGPRGGVVSHESGAEVVVPDGALDTELNVSIELVEDGYPALSVPALGGVYAVTPHGAQFNVPVTLRIPHEVEAQSGMGLSLLTAQPGGSWEKLEDATFFEGYWEVEVTHFSYFYNGLDVCGLAYQECCTSEVEQPCAGDLLECHAGSNHCLPCGAEIGDPCCGGATCLGTGEAGESLTCNTVASVPTCQGPGGGSTGGGGMTGGGGTGMMPPPP